mgnify:CR=1 FL=1
MLHAFHFRERRYTSPPKNQKLIIRRHSSVTHQLIPLFLSTSQQHLNVAYPTLLIPPLQPNIKPRIRFTRKLTVIFIRSIKHQQVGGCRKHLRQ